MKVLSLFVAILLVALSVAVLVSASSFKNEIEREKQEFTALKQEFYTKGHDGKKNLIVNTSKLSVASLPGCLTMSSCKICGYYCGPGWCSDKYISEAKCVHEGVWGIAPEHSEHCVDECCKTHDHCCGAGTDRHECNRNIVSCIDSNDCGGLCADAVHVALKIVSHFCCGSPCPSYSADEHGNFVPMNLAGKSFCFKKTTEKDDEIHPALASLKFSFTPSKTKSDNSDVTLFKTQIANCASGEELDVALHQGSNRVTIGSQRHEAGDKMQLPESCVASASVLGELASSSKTWYFPYTEELFVKNGKTNTYHTFEKCE